ncbi:MAG: hypothetical protein Q9218_006033 [Villophora microphyllina]
MKMFILAALSYTALLLPNNALTASIPPRTADMQTSSHGLMHRNAQSTLTIFTVTNPRTWHDWKGVEKIFSFGDSYTDSGFNPTGPQPDDIHPLGNPFSNSTTPPYHTFTNGPNWIEFLTFKYNESQIDTYNMAISGSTVNDTAIGGTSTADLVHQISDRFVPNYVRKNTVRWTPSNSLFTLFFGINDVNRSWNKRDPKFNDAVFTSYMNLLHQLYRYGARNFLLHTVPPIDRGPYVSKPDATIEAPDINDFNYRMQVLFKSFTATHHDVSVLLFNTNKLFSEAIDNPSVWPQTAVYKNTTGSCKAYETGDVPAMDYYDPGCQYRVNEYLWLNGLHPTYPIHEAMAAQVALALKE